MYRKLLLFFILMVLTGCATANHQVEQQQVDVPVKKISPSLMAKLEGGSLVSQQNNAKTENQQKNLIKTGQQHDKKPENKNKIRQDKGKNKISDGTTYKVKYFVIKERMQKLINWGGKLLHDYQVCTQSVERLRKIIEGER